MSDRLHLSSIVVGVIVGFAAAFMFLFLLGTARAPLHIVFILVAGAIGIGVGMTTARRVEARNHTPAGS